MVDPTISSASHSSGASSDGLLPTRQTGPVVNGLSSGTQSLPSCALMIGAPSLSAVSSSSAPAPRAPAPARIATFALPPSVSAARLSSSGSATRAGTWKAVKVCPGTLRMYRVPLSAEAAW